MEKITPGDLYQPSQDEPELSESDKRLLEKLEQAESWADATAEILTSINEESTLQETDEAREARFREYEEFCEKLNAEQEGRRELIQSSGLGNVFAHELSDIFGKYKGKISKGEWKKLSQWEKSPEALKKRREALKQKSRELWGIFFHPKHGAVLNGEPWEDWKNLEPFSQSEIQKKLAEKWKRDEREENQALTRKIVEDVLREHKIQFKTFRDRALPPEEYTVIEKEIQKKFQEEKERQRKNTKSGHYKPDYSKVDTYHTDGGDDQINRSVETAA